MSIINAETKEIALKVVYYGPGLSGKTTSLQAVHTSIPKERRPKLVSVATEEDRTLFCDFLPVSATRLGPYAVRLHLYTVPGQVFYNSTRKLVLRGADGVIFVADSQSAMRAANVESWQNLKENLAEWGEKLEALPHVFQFNKRDLPEIRPVAQMAKDLNEFDVTCFTTIAECGEGILEPLKEVTRLILREMVSKGVGRAPAAKPAHEQRSTVTPPPAPKKKRRATIPPVDPKRKRRITAPPADPKRKRRITAPPIDPKVKPSPPPPGSSIASAIAESLPQPAEAAAATGSEAIGRPEDGAVVAVSAEGDKYTPVGMAPLPERDEAPAAADVAPAPGASEGVGPVVADAAGEQVLVAAEQRGAAPVVGFSIAACWEDSVLRSEARILEELISVGRFGEAVVKASQMVGFAAALSGHRGEEALFVLLHGVSGSRYRRFHALVNAGLRGEPLSEVDALFALHFATEFALPY